MPHQHEQPGENRKRSGNPGTLQHAVKVGAFPAQHGANGHEEKQRQHDGPEGEIEVRRANGYFFAGDGFKRQGIKRSDQHRGAGRAEEKVVQHQAAFAADGREDPPAFRVGARQANSVSAPPMKKPRMARMNTPRSGSLAKAWTEVRTPERTRKVPSSEKPEGQDGQQDGPALQRLALFHDDGRMQQGRRDQPGHEAGIFDRVPEPPAAPAQFVIGPPAIPCAMPMVRNIQAASVQGRTQRAQAASTLPSIKAATAKEKAIRQADIARVEKRRMEGQAGSCSSGFRPCPSMGRDPAAGTDLRSTTMKSRKATPIAPCTASTRALQGRRQVAAEGRHGRAEQRKDQHPEQHRAFVVAPDAGDLVEQAAWPSANSQRHSAPKNRRSDRHGSARQRPHR